MSAGIAAAAAGTSADPGTTGIQVRALGKSFGDVRALDGLDLTVARGEVVALLGRNGAGKTTLMRILGTTLRSDEGEASVGGFDVRREGIAVRRAVGLVLGDERSLYWRLTGRHNLEFFAELHGVRGARCRERVGALLDEVGLDGAADRAVSGYSSGMRMRLALARALVAEPQVLLLDEPTRSLDPVATVEFRAMLREIVARRGASVLIATHDLREPAGVDGRVCLLSRGRIAVELAPETDPDELERLLAEAG
ncbi:MAG: ABC transporter ATP-binding protein [Gaiellaceae bacterium]